MKFIILSLIFEFSLNLLKNTSNFIITIGIIIFWIKSIGLISLSFLISFNTYYFLSIFSDIFKDYWIYSSSTKMAYSE